MTHQDDVTGLLETWFARDARPPGTEALDHLAGPLLQVEATLTEQERAGARAGVVRGGCTVRGAVTELPDEAVLAAHVDHVREGLPTQDVEVGVLLEAHADPWQVRPGSDVANGAKAPRPVVNVAVHTVQEGALVRWTPLGWRIVDKREGGEWYSRHFCPHVTAHARLGPVRIEAQLLFRGPQPDVVGLYLALHNSADRTLEVTPVTTGRRLLRREPAWQLPARSTTVVGINSGTPKPEGRVDTFWSVGRGLRAPKGLLVIEYAGPEHPGRDGWCG